MVLATSGGCELVAGIEDLGVVGDEGAPEGGSDASVAPDRAIQNADDSGDAPLESDADIEADVIAADASVGSDAGQASDASALADAGGADASAVDGGNLLLNSSCEDGTLGWSSLGGTPIESSTLYVHSGDHHSCRAYKRGSAFNGPMQDITAVVVPGHQYSASAWGLWALPPDAGSQAPQTQSIFVTALQTCVPRGADAGTTSYVRLASATSAPAAQWVAVTGTTGALSVPTTCSSLDLQLYVEGPDGGLDLYADEVTLLFDN